MNCSIDTLSDLKDNQIEIVKGINTITIGITHHTLTDIGGGGFPWVDPGSNEDHLAASAGFKVLGRGDSEKIKTTLLL